MNSSIENKCIQKGVRLTDQRRIIAKVMSESTDHPDVDELHKKINKLPGVTAERNKRTECHGVISPGN